MSHDNDGMGYLLSFWRRVEERFTYKIIFALLFGLCGALFAVLMALLVLVPRNIGLKWIFFLIGFGFIVSIVLAPIQYRICSKRYHEYVDVHQRKNTDPWMKKLK